MRVLFDACGEISQRRSSAPYATEATYMHWEVATASVCAGARVATASCPAGDSWVPVRRGDPAGNVC